MILIRLKEQYVGITITRTIGSLGEVTLEANTDNGYYHNYYNLGFQDLFEVYDTESDEFITPKKVSLSKF